MVKLHDGLPACDFCVHYRFNDDTEGYTGGGFCAHPLHPDPMDPGDSCEDFRCVACDGVSPQEFEAWREGRMRS